MNNPVHHPSSPRILLLGIGSAKDRALKANLLAALNQLQLEIPVEEVSDLDLLLSYGIAGIPALIIDDKVVFQKVVPSTEDLLIVLNVLLKAPETPSLQLQRIVVPTDFSAAAENAFHYALGLASSLNSGVHLVHIKEPPSASMGSPLFFDPHKSSPQEHQQRLERLVRRGEKWLRQQGKSPVALTFEVLTGFIQEELQRLSKAADTDLLVLDANPNQGVLSKWFGSSRADLARRAFSPVILVPENCAFTGYQDIIYASSHDPGDHKILPELLDFTSFFNASLHFVHVNHRSTPQQAAVNTVKNNQNLEFHLATVSNRDVLAGLHEYVATHTADLLVMGTAHRHFFQEMLGYSYTRNMAATTPIPLMILHFDD